MATLPHTNRAYLLASCSAEFLTVRRWATVGPTPASARDPLVALLRKLSILTPDSTLAWIPTGISWPNKKDLLSENQTKVLAVEPWNRQICLVESGCQQQGIVRPFLKAHLDFLIGNRHASPS